MPTHLFPDAPVDALTVFTETKNGDRMPVPCPLCGAPAAVRTSRDGHSYICSTCQRFRMTEAKRYLLSKSTDDTYKWNLSRVAAGSTGPAEFM